MTLEMEYFNPRVLHELKKILKNSGLNYDYESSVYISSPKRKHCENKREIPCVMFIFEEQ